MHCVGCCLNHSSNIRHSVQFSFDVYLHRGMTCHLLTNSTKTVRIHFCIYHHEILHVYNVNYEHLPITKTKAPNITRNEIHNLQTRNAHKLNLTGVKNNYGKSTFKYKGAKMYNELPNDIMYCKSLNIFKNRTKKYCKSFH